MHARSHPFPDFRCAKSGNGLKGGDARHIGTPNARIPSLQRNETDAIDIRTLAMTHALILPCAWIVLNQAAQILA